MNRLMFFILLLFSNIIISAQEKLSYEDLSKTSKEIGEKYFASYLAMDWDKIETMLADNATFTDPTAETVFGGGLRDGKEAMMKSFREGYASIEELKFIKSRTIFSGNYAIFEGDLDWTVRVGNGKKVSTVMPIITMLKIENRKVTEHRDFADYHPFLVEFGKARNAE